MLIKVPSTLKWPSAHAGALFLCIASTCGSKFIANYDTKVFVVVDAVNCLVNDNLRGDNCRIYIDNVNCRLDGALMTCLLFMTVCTVSTLSGSHLPQNSSSTRRQVSQNMLWKPITYFEMPAIVLIIHIHNDIVLRATQLILCNTVILLNRAILIFSSLF